MVFDTPLVLGILALILGAAVVYGLKRSYIVVNPDEYVVHYRNGKVKHIGRGISFFCFPYDTYIKVPGTLRDVNFVADQITRERQGVRVQGFLAYRISNFELAFKALDLRSNSIRVLPRAEENTKNKDYEAKNRELLLRLDPNDPLAKTDEVIRRIAESVVRHEVSNKTVDQMISEREVVIESMREQLLQTVIEWGVAIDTIEFTEVWIRSKEVFENLQAHYRNKLRLEAESSTAQANEQISRKKIESEKRIAMMASEAGRERRVLAAEQNREAALAEQASEHAQKQKELNNERELAILQKEGQYAADLREQELLHERELVLRRHQLEEQEEQHRIEMDKRQKLEDVKRREAETERALVELAERTRLQQVQLEQEREAVRLKAELDEKENEQKMAQIDLATEVERVQKLAAAQLVRATEEAKAIVERGRAEAEARRMHIEASNAVMPATLQQQLIESIPQIASKMKVGDVHWVSMGGSGDGESPLSILPRNILELLTVLKGFGLDVARITGVPQVDSDAGPGNGSAAATGNGAEAEAEAEAVPLAAESAEETPPQARTHK